jgi:hypothetical protein
MPPPKTTTSQLASPVSGGRETWRDDVARHNESPDLNFTAISDNYTNVYSYETTALIAL